VKASAQTMEAAVLLCATYDVEGKAEAKLRSKELLCPLRKETCGSFLNPVIRGLQWWRRNEHVTAV
jgi:hypothetical protein